MVPFADTDDAGRTWLAGTRQSRSTSGFTIPSSNASRLSLQGTWSSGQWRLTMRTAFIAMALAGLLFPPPASAQQSSSTTQTLKMPQEHEAFLAEYRQLLKKHPKAGESFMLRYEVPTVRDLCHSPVRPCGSGGFTYAFASRSRNRDSEDQWRARWGQKPSPPRCAEPGDGSASPRWLLRTASTGHCR